MLIIPTEKRFDWKHAPIVLSVLVILNVVIYFGYQFGDDAKVFKALVSYNNQNFLEKEWPVYQKYLEANNDVERLQNDKELYELSKETENNYRLLYNIVSDGDFYNHLDVNSYNLFTLNYLEKWAIARLEINRQIQSISSISLGLIPHDFGVITLLTHQFLHGSVMHLLGNLFFLIICGFAVEAAIGHLRFLLYYLASGVAGGLMFALMDMTSTQPLVGASGAISGVMAMYLGVFRFKKIEFFYWLFVFVGYFRAPALLILPFYIGKELYSFFNDTGSDVAFMAHTGGFVAGGVLMALTYFIKPDVFNDKYIEEDQDLPKLQIDLAKVNDHISKSRFVSATKGIDDVIKEHGKTFDRVLLKFNLLNMQKHASRFMVFDYLLNMHRLQSFELTTLVKIWDNNDDFKTELSVEDLYKLGWNLTSDQHIDTAESIFIQLNKLQIKHPTLGLFARKLSVVFGKMNHQEKKKEYELLAVKLLEGLV